MATTDKLPSRLHHNAYVSKDLEATRRVLRGPHRPPAGSHVVRGR